MDEYQRFARLYDPLITPALRPVYRKTTELLVRHGCASTVDLCCGTGVLTGMIARSSMTASGVDLSTAMLGQATRKQPARFVRANATALPFNDNAFDGAAVSFSLHEKPWDTARSILSEARRVVRPGGLIVVADYRANPGNSRWTGYMVAAVERMAGRGHHGHFKEYMSKGGTDQFLREAGLASRCEQTFFSGWAGVYSVSNP